MKKYSDSLYRVSLKAIIRDDAGKVLVVKEAGSNWNLPGGGLDHGETVLEGLKRELYEELLITSPFMATLVGTEVMYIESRDIWQLWLVHEVQLEQFEYRVGPDADEAALMNTDIFKDSHSRDERFVYKFTHREVT